MAPTVQPGLEEPAPPDRTGGTEDHRRPGDRKAHLLLVHPGLIARYDQMAVLETLRDRVGHDVPCPGLWVLVATDGQNDMPMLDHAEIPLITPGQRAKVSESWIDNLHRGRSRSRRPRVAGKKGGG